MRIHYYAYNTTHPPLDDPRVRQALFVGLDRKAINDDLLRGYGDVAVGNPPADVARRRARRDGRSPTSFDPGPAPSRSWRRRGDVGTRVPDGLVDKGRSESCDFRS